MTLFSSLQSDPPIPQVRLKFVGVGGAGGNFVDRLARDGAATADLIALNTDRQALAHTAAHQRLCLGPELTRGMGAGGDPVVGQRAAEASGPECQQLLGRADLVFIAAGMGGGTGTGAAPVVAGLAREQGALSVAVVTRPFSFEGRRRASVAEQGIAQLRAIADTVIVIPNDRLLQIAARTTSIRDAFGHADTVLRLGVQGLADLIAQPGLVNVDFADVRAIMGDAGPGMLGIGVGSGPDRAVEAVRRAMACPLLEGCLEGARRLLLHISGGEDLSLYEINRAAELLTRTVDADANLIFGATIAPQPAGGKVKVTLVAAGFDPQRTAHRPLRPAPQREPQPARSAAPPSPSSQLRLPRS